MARTNVPVTTLTAATAVTGLAGGGTAIDATNHHEIALTFPLEELVLRVANTTASEKAATIKAGDSPPANAAGQGDLAVTLAAGNSTTQIKYVAGLESARFIQNDGKLHIDIASGMTGFLFAFRVPRV